MPRPWTHSESLFLKRDAERCGLPWCAAELRRTVEDCAVQLEALKHGAVESEWMTPREAGALASCSASTIRALIVAGQVEGRKDGTGCWVASRRSVIAYAGRHERCVQRGKSDRPKAAWPARVDSILDCIEIIPAPEMPKKAPERLAEAKESVPAVVLRKKPGDAPEGPLEAQNGHEPEKAQEAGMDLGSMSKLDILRAIAAGKMEAVNVG